MSNIASETTNSSTKSANDADVSSKTEVAVAAALPSDELDNSLVPGPSGVDGCGDCDHPWPYLQSMFKIKCIQSKTIRFICLLCTPKVCELSAYTNSPSNLKKHVEVSA